MTTQSQEAIMRNGLSLLIGCLVTGLMAWTAPIYPIKPIGIFLPEQVLSSKTHYAVRLYDHSTEPLFYKTLGHVNVQFHADEPSINVQDQVISYAKQLASDAGGDGIIVDVIGFTTSETPSPLKTQVLQGTVIHSGI